MRRRGRYPPHHPHIVGDQLQIATVLQVLCKLWSNDANPSSGDCQLPARRQKTALRTRRLGGGELARQPTRRTSRSTTRIRKDSSRSTASELNLYQDCMEPIADKPLEARGAKGGTSLGLAPGLGYVGQPQAKPKQPWAAWIWMPWGSWQHCHQSRNLRHPLKGGWTA